MVSVSFTYDTILDLIRKDQKGRAFSIPEFNDIIKLVNYELYSHLAPKSGQDTDVIEALKDFVVLGATISLTSGVGSIPSGYERIQGKPYVISGADTIPVDVITSLELPDRLEDELTKPSALHPVAIIGGAPVLDLSQITVYPDTISDIRVSYLKIPATPLLDYYILSTGQYFYLDEDATGITIPVGAVYSDGVTVNPSTVDSLTVNFEWREDQTPILVNMVLQKAGIVLESQIPIEYGIAKQNKEEQQ
jgi:hypothetical protein